jgi:hypothetical protein
MHRRGAGGKSRGTVPLRPDPIDGLRPITSIAFSGGEKPCCASQQKSAADDSYGSIATDPVRCDDPTPTATL